MYRVKLITTVVAAGFNIKPDDTSIVVKQDFSFYDFQLGCASDTNLDAARKFSLKAQTGLDLTWCPLYNVGVVEYVNSLYLVEFGIIPERIQLKAGQWIRMLDLLKRRPLPPPTLEAYQLIQNALPKYMTGEWYKPYYEEKQNAKEATTG